MKWTDKEIESLENDYPNADPDTLKLNLNRHTWGAIKRKAYLLGLKRNFKSGIVIDEDFFKTWTPEMAYIFGFWIADGNMSEKRNIVSFDSNDCDLLEIIKSNLKSEHKISKNGENGSKLSICNETIYNDILKLGGIPKKSLTIQFPIVPDAYLSHFIRGYLDGDGSNYIHMDNRGNGYRYLATSFVGNIDFLTTLKSKIAEHTNIGTGKLYPIDKKCNPRIKRLVYTGKKAIALYDWIYQKSENLCLERKFEISEKYVEIANKRIEPYLEQRKIGDFSDWDEAVKSEGR